MNREDEKVRDIVTDAFTRGGIDGRNLAVEVVNGRVTVEGSVPTAEQRDRIGAVLENATSAIGVIRVGVVPAAPSDTADGRGRSPLTGTSADSAHESRHQRDP